MTVIRVKNGQLRGKTQETQNGLKYFSFQGIPYAKPPVADLRFKDPEKCDNWKNIKDAMAEGNVCPQIDRQTGNVVGNEDCLFLNVYTPSLDDKKLATMVWIHGGGFFKGSGNYDSYGPDYLIEKNVVCVTINYRFGIFGFLCLHNTDVPGNAGLKDQLLALHWIKDNISYFGGDPNNITVFGESAGAASISFLTLSPAAKGLFNKAIIQSGTSLCSWALQNNPLMYAYKIAKNLGCNNENDVLKFLQNIPYEELLSQSLNILTDEDSKKYLPTAFLPVVEKVLPNLESIINEPPENIMESGRFPSLPTIAGYSSKEGLFMFEKIGFDTCKLKTLVDDLQHFLPAYIVNNKNMLKKCVEELAIKYFDGKQIDDSQLNGVIDLLSDFLFRHPLNWNVHILSKHSSAPVYYFQFSYQGNLSRDKKRFQELNLNGASHSEEVGYLFRKKYMDEEEAKPEDLLTRRRLVDMWTNFAKSGNPTPEINDVIPVLWKPATKENLNYLEIGKNFAVSRDPNVSSLKLWMDFVDMRK